MSAPQGVHVFDIHSDAVSIGWVHTDLTWTNPLFPRQASPLQLLQYLVHRCDKAKACILAVVRQQLLELLHRRGRLQRLHDGRVQEKTKTRPRRSGCGVQQVQEKAQKGTWSQPKYQNCCGPKILLF